MAEYQSKNGKLVRRMSLDEIKDAVKQAAREHKMFKPKMQGGRKGVGYKSVAIDEEPDYWNMTIYPEECLAVLKFKGREWGFHYEMKDGKAVITDEPFPGTMQFVPDSESAGDEKDSDD